VQQPILHSDTLIDARFRISDLAGAGGMGQVYRAEDIQFSRTVAVKMLRREGAESDAIKRFHKEAKTVARLQHPNIAAIYSFGVFGDFLYIAMEYLEGRTLQSVLEEKQRLEWPDFYRIFRQLCLALSYAHGESVIHRDIKPGNIFLTGDSVKLVDFGIAKCIEPTADGSQRLTATGTVLGTPLYMSPEQSGGNNVTGRADLYSLGCVMYQACYGKPPFEGSTAYEVLFQHAYEEPQLPAPPAGYPVGITQLLARALAKKPADRYADAADMLAGLDELQKSGTLAGSAKRRKRLLHFKLRPQLLLLTASVALAATAAIAFYLLQTDNPVVIPASDDLRVLDNQLMNSDNTIDIDALYASRADQLTLSKEPVAVHVLTLMAGQSKRQKMREELLDRATYVFRSVPSEVWSNPATLHALQEYGISMLRTRIPDERSRLGEFTLQGFNSCVSLQHDGNPVAAHALCGELIWELKHNYNPNQWTHHAIMYCGRFQEMRNLQIVDDLASVIEHSENPVDQIHACIFHAMVKDADDRPRDAVLGWQQAQKLFASMPLQLQSAYLNLQHEIWRGMAADNARIAATTPRDETARSQAVRDIQTYVDAMTKMPLESRVTGMIDAAAMFDLIGLARQATDLRTAAIQQTLQAPPEPEASPLKTSQMMLSAAHAALINDQPQQAVQLMRQVQTFDYKRLAVPSEITSRDQKLHCFYADMLECELAAAELGLRAGASSVPAAVLRESLDAARTNEAIADLFMRNQNIHAAAEYLTKAAFARGRCNDPAFVVDASLAGDLYLACDDRRCADMYSQVTAVKYRPEIEQRLQRVLELYRARAYAQTGTWLTKSKSPEYVATWLNLINGIALLEKCSPRNAVEASCLAQAYLSKGDAMRSMAERERPKLHEALKDALPEYRRAADLMRNNHGQDEKEFRQAYFKMIDAEHIMGRDNRAMSDLAEFRVQQRL
jgi:serine/threonine protein kinase